MKDEDIDRLLAEMCVAWPNHTLLEPQARLWRDRLRSMSTDAVFEAAKLLVDRSRWWPSWSEMREAYRAEKRRLDLREAERGLPSPEPTEEQKAETRQIARSNIRKIRATLEEKRKNETAET